MKEIIKTILWIILMVLIVYILFYFRINSCSDSGFTMTQCRSIIFGI